MAILHALTNLYRLRTKCAVFLRQN